ncbi:hypothetical protein BZZ01_23070 [Nostocales cyanobacterium HT-58-2]|nr:hypothetical protein BZZ01_23070 [Nostocales cyanobacterium HT-58-2]
MKRFVPITLLGFLFTASIALLHLETPIIAQSPNPSPPSAPMPTPTPTPTPTRTPRTPRIYLAQNHQNF